MQDLEGLLGCDEGVFFMVKIIPDTLHNFVADLLILSLCQNLLLSSSYPS